MPEWGPTLLIGASMLVLGALCASLLFAAMRFRHKEPSASLDAPESDNATLTNDSVIRTLSSRVAELEGQIPTLRSGLDAYGSLATRVAAIETQIPAVADAYEKFADTMLRKGKRDAVREARSGKSAGEAAAETFGFKENAGESEAASASGLPQRTNGGPAEGRKLAGVRGRGGRSSFRRGRAG